VVPSTVSAFAAQADRLADAEVVRAHDEGCVVRFDLGDGAVLSTLATHGTAAIRSLSVSPSDARLCVDLPSDANPRVLVEALRRRHDGVDLVARRERERPRDGRDTLLDTIDESLTDRQREALRTAHTAGFFAWPRDSSGEEIASMMDITQSTFLQHLRAAERKVFDELLDGPRVATTPSA
jgi:predicted DNA binding protein